MANPAVRTAPALTASPNVIRLSIHVIDASGDLYAESIEVPSSMTTAEQEALVANYQLSTQASVYKVETTFIHSGDDDSDNADTLQRNSVKQGINMLFKDGATLQTTTPRVVAPVPAILQGNQDIPLLVAPLTALTASFLIGLAPMTLNSMQYTERRERSNNPRVKV